MQVVVFHPRGGAYLLDNIKRNRDGTIKQAYVANGAWTMARHDGKIFEHRHDNFNDRMTDEVIDEVEDWEFKEFVVPSELEYKPHLEVSHRNDYHFAIEWARKQND